MGERRLFVGHTTHTPRAKVVVMGLPPGWGRSAILNALRAGAEIHDPAAAEIVAEYRAEQVAAAKRARAVWERGQHAAMPALQIKRTPRIAAMPSIKIGGEEPRAHTAPPARPLPSGHYAMPGLKIGSEAPRVEQRGHGEMPAAFRRRALARAIARRAARRGRNASYRFQPLSSPVPAHAHLATEPDDRRAEPGELRLIAAVLQLALHDARRGDASAIAWLASDESGRSPTGYFFIDVCAVLDVEPAWVRQQARERVRPRGGRRAGRRFLKLEVAA